MDDDTISRLIGRSIGDAPKGGRGQRRDRLALALLGSAILLLASLPVLSALAFDPAGALLGIAFGDAADLVGVSP